MATYNFLRESEVYLVYGGNQYRVDVYPNMSCSQTFTEESYPVKTLHNQSLMFEGSSIARANPANFDFTIPSLRENDLDIVLDLLLDYDTSLGQQLIKTFDLYTTAFPAPLLAVKIQNLENHHSFKILA